MVSTTTVYKWPNRFLRVLVLLVCKGSKYKLKTNFNVDKAALNG